MMNSISSALRRIVIGTPWGRVVPTRSDPRQPPEDGRTAALRSLSRYLAEVTFFRAGARSGPSIPFRVPRESIHIEWADYEVPDEYPALVMLQQNEGSYEADVDYLGPSSIDDETRDVFGPGTALVIGPDYNETFVIEAHSALKPERRSLIAGLERALLSPMQDGFGVRLLMPDYFNLPVDFLPLGRRIDESPDSARNRRIARLTVQMFFPTALLVNVVTMRPVVKVSVDVDVDTGLAVVLDVNDSNTVVHQP
jgi:hypothetical protein